MVAPSFEPPFRPCPAAVALRDTLDDRQTHSGSFEFLRPVQALEHTEQFMDISVVESDPIVANPIHDLLGMLGVSAPADLDSRAFAGTGVFQCIGQQIDPHLLEQTTVGVDSAADRSR